MGMSKYLSRSNWRAPLTVLLCSSIVLGGCPRKQPSAGGTSQGVDVRKLLQERYGRILSEETQNIPREKIAQTDPEVRVKGLDDPAILKADGINGYDAFTARFEHETGEKWEEVKKRFNRSYAGLQSSDPVLPSAADIVAAVKAADRDDPALTIELNAQKRGSIKAFLATHEEFEKQAQIASEKLRDIEEVTADLFKRVRTTVDAVEQLRGVTDPEEIRTSVEAIVSQSLPAMLRGVEELQGKALKELTEAGAKAKSAAEEKFKELKQQWGAIKKFLSADVVQKIEEYIGQADEFLRNVSVAANAFSSMMVMAEGLAAVFGVAPWVAAAVLIVLAILALFAGGSGGGGDGEGEGEGETGHSGPAASGSGEEQGGTVGDTRGDETIEENPGLQNQGPPLKRDAAANIGSTVKQSEDGPWFDTGWVGSTFRIRCVFKVGAERRPIDLSIPEGEKGQNEVLRQLSLARNGEKNINVASISSASGSFPITVTMTGFNTGSVSIKWEEADRPAKIEGL